MSDKKEEYQASVPPKMVILNQFIKDLSFENIAAQNGLKSENLTPDIKVNVTLEAKKRPIENQYDVIIKTTISSETKNTKEMLFMLEIDYGGIFEITNIPEDQLHPYLLIECPRILFPYLRRIISDITRDGGYPALNLDQIDFLSIYNAELNKKTSTNSKII
ncbi:MAG: protein-export chaperone SecB [Paracoccaceae bacterium]